MNQVTFGLNSIVNRTAKTQNVLDQTLEEDIKGLSEGELTAGHFKNR